MNLHAATARGLSLVVFVRPLVIAPYILFFCRLMALSDAKLYAISFWRHQG